MKRILSSLIITLSLSFVFIGKSFGQEESSNDAAALTNDGAAISSPDQTATEAGNEGSVNNSNPEEKDASEDVSFIQKLKQKYIEGDVLWMTPVLICLIIGMALSIERIIYLNLSTINTSKFLQDVEKALQQGGVDKAKELCRNTRGPIASIFYQGLDRAGEGLDMVEKSVVAYGGVQMGNMEKGLSWLQLFIALSPMLGFLGTVIGMIQAFDQIVKDGQVSPTTVADGIKVALLTTVFGLIAAIALQIFYNYITSKIDGLVNEMEDASISLIDILLKNKAVK